jgi:hypothetical protein
MKRYITLQEDDYTKLVGNSDVQEFATLAEAREHVEEGVYENNPYAVYQLVGHAEAETVVEFVKPTPEKAKAK